MDTLRTSKDDQADRHYKTQTKKSTHPGLGGRVASGIDEGGAHGTVAGPGRAMQGCETVPGSAVHQGAVVQQQLDHRTTTPFRSHVQRSDIVLKGRNSDLKVGLKSRYIGHAAARAHLGPCDRPKKYDN